MYVGVGPNEYHHLKVRNVKYATSSNGIELAFLDCMGKTLQRSTTTQKGWLVKTYFLTCVVRDFLVAYVQSEIEEGDDIFVIGHPEPAYSQVVKTGRNETRLVADCIYKEDFLKYYSSSKAKVAELDFS